MHKRRYQLSADIAQPVNYSEDDKVVHLPMRSKSWLASRFVMLTLLVGSRTNNVVVSRGMVNPSHYRSGDYALVARNFNLVPFIIFLLFEVV
jgi:hypothetical protein